MLKKRNKKLEDNFASVKNELNELTTKFQEKVRVVVDKLDTISLWILRKGKS